MGRCQGRFCAATIARLCPDAPDDFAFAAPRAPLRPVPAAPLMFEAPEFEAPLLKLPTAPVHLHRLPEQPQETRRCDVLVIGGGLAGLCSAYFLAQRRRRRAARRTRRGRHGGEHRECRQSARATAVVRLHRRDAGGWRPGGAHAAAGAPLHRAVEGDRAGGRRGPGHPHRRRPDAGRGRRRARLAAPQVGDGAALGHRKPRARRERTARAGAGRVREHGRSRLRPGRGLWRSAARHHGGAETGAACRRPSAARRRGAGDRARGRGVARADIEGADHRRPRGECRRAMGGAHRT